MVKIASLENNSVSTAAVEPINDNSSSPSGLGIMTTALSAADLDTTIDQLAYMLYNRLQDPKFDLKRVQVFADADTAKAASLNDPNLVCFYPETAE